MINRVKNTLRRIHNDEKGMEALQVVLILAIAAIILAFAYKIFNGNSDTDANGSNMTIVQWVLQGINNIVKWK
ncbi:MAG: hypothetical protein RLZZ232_3117 [Planctomycetota bacterium]|jgi:hypothetical protein